MKKITLLAAFIIIFNPSKISSQDTNLFPVKSNGSRVVIDISSQLLNITDEYNSSIVKSTRLNATMKLDAAAWQYTKKINYIASVTGNNRLDYEYSKEQDESISRLINDLNGMLYGSADYYFKPGEFYINGGYGVNYYYRYYKHKYEPETINSINQDNGSISINNYIWLAAGFGRLVNKARLVKLENFERVLQQKKLITGQLSSGVKKKLLNLIEKRNNRDYISKYKDNDEIKFMGDVEKLLTSESVIDRPAGAETVMMLYQSLTNNKFVYYPGFTGVQTQAELLVQPLYDKSEHDFITISSAYGIGLAENTNALFTGFISFPLRTKSTDTRLFGFYARNPLSNMLPLIAELYGLDNYQYSFYGDGQGVTRSDSLSFVTGIKYHIFHSFSDKIGLVLWGQGVVSKPKETGFRNTVKIGLQTDYNIISVLKFTAAFNWFRNNSGFQHIYFSVGSSVIIL